MKSAIRSSAVLMLLQSVVAVQLSFAQCEDKTGFARKACEVESGGNGGSLSSQLSSSGLNDWKGAPLTTSFSDTIHPDTLPATVEPKAFAPLTKLNRADDGSFILKVGIFEAYLESYSLDPGQGGSRVGGFYPAPIKGRRAKVIAGALKQAELHPDVTQGDIQQFLWAVVGGADLEKMPQQVQQTAAKILPKETLALIQGSVIAKTTERSLLSMLDKRLARDTRLNQDVAGAEAKLNQTDQKYGVTGTAEDLKSGSVPDDGPVVRGAWAQMPGGFYVRYLPDGHAKTRLQVIVPDAALAQSDAKTPLVFDPTQYLAVFAGSPAQRLGITMRRAH